MPDEKMLGDAKAIVLFPYLHSQDGPEVFVWVIPQGQDIPGHSGCDLEEFAKRQLAAETGGTYDVPLYVLAAGSPTVIVLPGGEEKEAWDPNHNQSET